MTDKSAERVLLLRLKNGDEDAFMEIFAPLRYPLVRVIYKIIGSLQEAEDICQDTLAQLWERREEIDPDKNINAFTFLIAKRIAYKHIRKMQHTDDFEEVAYADSDLDFSPEEILREKEMQVLLRYAIEQLSPRTREIYELYYSEGLSYAQIAERLDINTDNVKAKIYQARTKIKDILMSIMLFLAL
jgi:RNA polymerase sigma-70 factor (ECF subfamily)